MADTCPTNWTQAMNGSYGVPPAQNGGHGGNMAGMVVQAVDAENGLPLGVSYTLHSALYTPDSNGAHMGAVTGPSGATSQQDLNARIFEDDASTGYNPANAVNNLRETTGDRGCAGWNAWGPQDSGQSSLNNAYVLDCGIVDSSGNTTLATQFWFDNVTPRPTGDTSDNGQNGYWEIQIYSPIDSNFGGGVDTKDIQQYNESSMGFNNNSFHVGNGLNTKVIFLWHPYHSQHNPPPGNTSSGTGTCQNFTASMTIGKPASRMYVSITGVTNGKVVYTNSDNQSTTYPGSGGDIAGWVNPGQANGDSSDPAKNISKVWYFQPSQNDITITTETDTWDKNANNGSGGWVGSPSSQTLHCFAACTSPLTAVGYGPNNVVTSGGSVHVTGTYTNTGALPLYWPVLLGSNGGYYAVNGLNADGSLNPGQTGTVDIGLTAPVTTPTLWTFTLTPTYDGVMGPPSCPGSFTVPIYQYFKISPAAKIADGTNPEDPFISGTSTQGVSYVVGGSLTEGITTNAATTGRLANRSGATVDGPHVTLDSYGVVSHQYDHAINSVNAGDQYCPSVTISPGNGYHGPPGYADVGDNDVTANGNCLTITNEPYFKAKGAGGLAADVSQVAMPDSSGVFTCPSSGSSGSGLLAGWNDNGDPAGADRGASSELNALALLQITGVASNQPASTVTNSPTGLSFANAGKYNAKNFVPTSPTDIASPPLGGYYGGSANCITPPSIPSDAQPMPDPGASPVTISSLASNGKTPHYQYGTPGTSTTPVIFGADTIKQPSTKVYVNGNVYISGNIVYSTSGWSYDPGSRVDSIPSLVLYASGNIYIDPGVSQLDGTYISGGTIYTCGVSTSQACASSSLYSTGKNQLVVNGSFVADQVKLMRTFGSLRDEKPTVVSGSTGLPTGVVWSSCGKYGKPQQGEPCLSASPKKLGLTCTPINEQGDPNGWNDNVLCLPKNSSLKLAWTSYAGNTCNALDMLFMTSGCNISSGRANLSYIQGHGYPYCTQWNAPDSKNYGWGDNWLCMNQSRPGTSDSVLQFSLTNDTSQSCTPISEVADDDGTSDGSQTWAKGYYLCEQKATGPSITPPNLTQCSNSAGATWTDRTTCAAEVFELSPEVYLTEPNGNGGSSSSGDDTITSLPPVL